MLFRSPDLRLPARLEDVVRRCLAKKAEDRYPDVQALMDDLAACAGLRAEPDTHTGSLQPEPPTTPPLVERPRRWPLVAVVLLLLLSITGVVLYATRPAPTPPTSAAPIVAPPVAPPVEAPAPEQPKPPVVAENPVTPEKGPTTAPVADSKAPPVRTHPPKKNTTPTKPENKAPEGYMGLPDDLK